MYNSDTMDALALIDKLENLYSTWGYPLVFFSSLIETSPFGFMIPGGLVVIGGGFFAYGNSTTLVGIILAGWSGMLVTFFIAYLLGKKTGLTLAKKLHQEKFSQRAEILLKSHGPMILTASLLANLIRFWVAYVAGFQNYNFLKFAFYAGVASLTWNSLLVTLGYLAGTERQQLERVFAKLGILGWGLLVLALVIIYLQSKKEFKQILNKK